MPPANQLGQQAKFYLMRIAKTMAALTGMSARASNQLSTVFVTLVATHFLSPSDFGEFALASIAITLIRTLLHTGAFEYLLKAPDPRQCASECLSANIWLALSLSLLLGIGTLGAIALLGSSQLTSIILSLIPSNVIASLGAWREALLLRERRLTLYYGMTMGSEIVSAAVGIFLFYADFGVYALVYQVYARNITTLALYMATGPIQKSEHFQWTKLREVIAWSWSRYASTLLGFGGNYGADIFLGVFLSPAATGLYRASSRLATAFSDVFTQPVKMIAMTTFSARAAKGEPSNATWPAMLALVLVTGGSVMGGVAVVAPQAIPLVFGDRWIDAAVLIPILTVARGASLVDSVTGSVLVAYNHQRTTLRVQIFASMVGLILLVCAAPFGLVPATIAIVTGGLVGSASIAAAAWRLVPPAVTGIARLPLLVLAPVIATIAGATAMQCVAAIERLRPESAAALAIAAGIAAWVMTMLLLRKVFRQLAEMVSG